jgi:hypothetical protein
MCCPTHDTRDELALAKGETPVFAEVKDFQCQCMFGRQCRRRATDEDFRCDWCRDIEQGHKDLQGHLQWWTKHNDRRAPEYESRFRRAIDAGEWASEPMFRPEMPMPMMPSMNLPPMKFEQFTVSGELVTPQTELRDLTQPTVGDRTLGKFDPIELDKDFTFKIDPDAMKQAFEKMKRDLGELGK